MLFVCPGPALSVCPPPPTDQSGAAESRAGVCPERHQRRSQAGVWRQSSGLEGLLHWADCLLQREGRHAHRQRGGTGIKKQKTVYFKATLCSFSTLELLELFLCYFRISFKITHHYHLLIWMQNGTPADWYRTIWLVPALTGHQSDIILSQASRAHGVSGGGGILPVTSQDCETRCCK